MNKNKSKGTMCAIISAIVFGFTPVLASWSYELGSNSITLTFYRNVLVLPIMLIILLVKKIDLRVTKSQFMQLALISILFSGSTTFLLYDSYNYIGIGLATTLHFLYPVLTVLFGFLIFKNRLDKNRIIALILAFIGVSIATGGSDSFAIKGIILAIASSVTYSGYLLSIEKSAIKDMNGIKAMFYICIVSSVFFAIIDIPSGNIVYGLNFEAFVYTFGAAVLNSLVAYVLLIIGIGLIGAGNAAIFSTLEPMSGVVCGIIILGETLSVSKLFSCILILVAVMIPIISDYVKSRVDLERH